MVTKINSSASESESLKLGLNLWLANGDPEHSLQYKGLEAVIKQFSDVDPASECEMLLRNGPKHFNYVIGEAAKRYNVSRDDLLFKASNLGTARLLENGHITSIKGELNTLRSVLEKHADKPWDVVLNSIDDRVRFHFPTTVTLDCSVKTEEICQQHLEELAVTCGIWPSEAYILAVLSAIMTLPGKQAFKEVIPNILNYFQIYLNNRQVLIREQIKVFSQATTTGSQLQGKVEEDADAEEEMDEDEGEAS